MKPWYKSIQKDIAEHHGTHLFLTMFRLGRVLTISFDFSIESKWIKWLS